MDVYNKIYEFCKVKNKGSVFQNELREPTPRVKWILDLLDTYRMDYELDVFTFEERQFSIYNIILKGTSGKWVTAHHDIVNPESDNANDNSCSVINAIALKKLNPSVNVVILDGEECGGLGSTRLSRQMVDNQLGEIDWILNLELTGAGGKEFFIGHAGSNGRLGTLVTETFECEILEVPFNDSVIFRKHGFDSIVINPLPREENGDFKIDMLFNCHSMKDSIDTISPEDMKIFTEEVLVPLVS